MESLSDPSNGLRVVATCYTEAHFPLMVSLQFWHSEPLFILGYDVQSHPFLAWRSEPPRLLVYDVQGHISQLDAHSYQFSLTFRAVVSAWHSQLLSSFRGSRPLHLRSAFRASILI